jgi:hypothetical protein
MSKQPRRKALIDTQMPGKAMEEMLLEAWRV